MAIDLLMGARQAIRRVIHDNYGAPPDILEGLIYNELVRTQLVNLPAMRPEKVAWQITPHNQDQPSMLFPNVLVSAMSLAYSEPIAIDDHLFKPLQYLRTKSFDLTIQGTVLNEQEFTYHGLTKSYRRCNPNRSK